jgi:diguanylate cyclase (GGDEF)-like protein/PAS domain S-box-containing protein
LQAKQSFQEKYLTLLNNYVNATDADRLNLTRALGQELAQAGISPEEISQLHRRAFQLLQGSSTSLPHDHLRSKPLVDLLTAYSQALLDKLSDHKHQSLEPAGKEYFQRAIQTGPLVIIISRIRDDLILDTNQSFERYLGYRREEVINRTTIELGILVEPVERERTLKAFQGTGLLGDFETKFRAKSGEIRDLLTTVQVIELDGEPCFLRMGYDITERKHAQDQLLSDAFHDAFHDTLTKLPNRALFIDRLQRAVERAKRNPDYAFAVLFLDIDHLKLVNDKYGHIIGDQLLEEVSRRLEGCLYPRDTVGRLGGDEFAIILDDIAEVSDALSIAARIHKELSASFSLSGHDVSISASTGIALSSTGYQQADDILRDADKAMYRAKVQGRGRNEVYDSALYAQAVARLKVKTDLLKAVEHREFKIHYQPLVSLNSGRIIGFEAFGKWEHPDRGLISLVDFLPLAEKTGMIIDIGRWILREACAQTRKWQEKFPADSPLQLSVNLYSKEFVQPDITESLSQTLTETGLGAANLSLEIMEGVITENPEAHTAVLADLRELGLRVYIDQFGTGHSSLSFMYQYPIDALKIAPTFISRIGPQGENLEIVRTIVMLAQDFGMHVIADGVETKKQLEQLRELNCRYGQGIYFSEPVDVKAAELLLATDPSW